jgi:hypothetical protein
VEDGLDVSQRPLMAPVLARRRNGGEGKQGAKEVLGWQRHFTTGEEARWPAGEPGGGSFDRPGGGLTLP